MVDALVLAVWTGGVPSKTLEFSAMGRFVSTRDVCAMALTGVVVMPLGLANGGTMVEPVGVRMEYPLETGWVSAHDAAVDDEFEIDVAGASWVRVHFSEVVLSSGCTLSVESMRDGEHQDFTAEMMKAWSESTAYFNGDHLRLVVHTEAGGVSHVVVDEVEIGLGLSSRGTPDQCGICGVDDREPSTEFWTGRIMPVVCTGSVVCEDSTVIGAGHCAGSGQVLQFHVPAADSACGVVQPPVADQFPLTVAASANGGFGSDWAVYRCGVNTLGETPYERYGEMKRVSTVVAENGVATDVWGYGVDDVCDRSRTQQHSPGVVMGHGTGVYAVTNDVRTGSSGSAVVVDGEIVGVMTICNLSCEGNYATRVDVAGFHAALAATMGCGCLADMDDGTGSGIGDGAVTIDDLLYYLDVFRVGGSRADVDNATGSGTRDGAVTIDDLLYYLGRFDSGC